MDDFECIGMSNGEAIALHLHEGHVFRFKPVPATTGWSLAISRQEKGDSSSDDPAAHAPAALRFVGLHAGALLESLAAPAEQG